MILAIILTLLTNPNIYASQLNIYPQESPGDYIYNQKMADLDSAFAVAQRQLPTVLKIISLASVKDARYKKIQQAMRTLTLKPTYSAEHCSDLSAIAYVDYARPVSIAICPSIAKLGEHMVVHILLHEAGHLVEGNRTGEESECFADDMAHGMSVASGYGYVLSPKDHLCGHTPEKYIR